MAEETPYSIGFQAIADHNAQILILGSMPSVTSLDQQHYYAHPRNAFWPIMSTLFKMDDIAVWDVLQSCQRQGSLDSSINPNSMIANNFSLFLQQHPNITQIIFNGAKAEQVFERYVLTTLDKQSSKILRQRLPSTSPAHASLKFDQKYALWQQALQLKS